MARTLCFTIAALCCLSVASAYPWLFVDEYAKTCTTHPTAADAGHGRPVNDPYVYYSPDILIQPDFKQAHIASPSTGYLFHFAFISILVERLHLNPGLANPLAPLLAGRLIEQYPVCYTKSYALLQDYERRLVTEWRSSWNRVPRFQVRTEGTTLRLSILHTSDVAWLRFGWPLQPM